MREKPKCPYCGAELEVTHAFVSDATAAHKLVYTCFCRECGVYTPKRPTPEEALSAALHRAEPENRLLTLGEAQQISSEDGGTWLEEKTAWGLAHITPIDNQTGACYIYTFFAKFPLMAEKYGKTWRCWLRNPTRDQMAAAKWEE